MTLPQCPICGEVPDIQLVDRTIGELYKVSHCSILVFGDPFYPNGKTNSNLMALGSAYARWDEAIREVRR